MFSAIAALSTCAIAIASGNSNTCDADSLQEETTLLQGASKLKFSTETAKMAAVYHHEQPLVTGYRTPNTGACRTADGDKGSYSRADHVENVAQCASECDALPTCVAFEFVYNSAVSGGVGCELHRQPMPAATGHPNGVCYNKGADAARTYTGRITHSRGYVTDGPLTVIIDGDSAEVSWVWDHLARGSARDVPATFQFHVTRTEGGVELNNENYYNRFSGTTSDDGSLTGVWYNERGRQVGTFNLDGWGARTYTGRITHSRGYVTDSPLTVIIDGDSAEVSWVWDHLARGNARDVPATFQFHVTRTEDGVELNNEDYYNRFSGTTSDDGSLTGVWYNERGRQVGSFNLDGWGATQ